MRRGAGGWTVLEMLAVTALVGLTTVTIGAIFPAVLREARAADERGQRLERRWETLRRLRADVARARSARIEGATLVLGGEREVRWIPAEGLLTRRAARGPRLPELALRAEFRVEARGAGTLVVYRLADGEAELAGSALVGSLPGGFR